MSMSTISTTWPVARKDYRCVWCWQPIPRGMKHYHHICKYDGELQSNRYHPECEWDCGEVAKAEGFYEIDFMPGVADRKEVLLRYAEAHPPEILIQK